MYYYRNRYYEPRIGRFTTRDPIGIAGGINLYGYVNNNPVNLTDPYGLWVALGERRVRYTAGSGSHSVIVLHPNNQNEFASDPRFYRNSRGEVEATLSANPMGGKLTSTPNDFADRPERLKTIQRVLDPLNRSDSQLIKDILNSASKYKNNFPYDPTPWPSDEYYNSNSYTRGVLKDAGIPNPPNLPAWQPGADKPIPLQKKQMR